MNKCRILRLATMIEAGISFNEEYSSQDALELLAYEVFSNLRSKRGILIRPETQRVLELDDNQASRLFDGNIHASRDGIVRVLRHLANTSEVDWSLAGRTKCGKDR